MEARRDGPAYAGTMTYHDVHLVLEADGLAGADVAIVGAPMDDMVTHRPGARFGPRAIRAATDLSGAHVWHLDLGVDPFAEMKVVDFGDAKVVPGDAHASHRAIRQAVTEIVSNGAIPIVLGGDHSIALPDITAVAAGQDDLAVVQFDTHADTATQNWGVEYSHGTPFRHLVDDGVIRGPRLVQVGLRGYWPNPDELGWMRDSGVHWYRMEEVVERGIDRVIGDVLKRIDGSSGMFLSVDIDALDPAFAPGTGTPEPGGMTTHQLLSAVRMLVLARGLAGMEVVEVSPPYDHAEITAMAAHRVVLEALSALAVHRRGGVPAPENPR